MKTDDAERIVKVIADSMEQGKEFVIQQAPDVVQQLVLLHRVESLLVFVFLVSVTAAMFSTARRWCGTNWDEDDIREPLSVMLFFLGFVVSLVLPFSAYDVALWWMAPNVAVLEWALHL